MNTNRIARASLFLGSLFIASLAHAQAAASDVHPVTVITLYSETRTAPQALPRADEAPKNPPIRIVNGGVKEPAGTCFDLDPSGHVTPAAGSCVILRSAQPGEQPPAN